MAKNKVRNQQEVQRKGHEEWEEPPYSIGMMQDVVLAAVQLLHQRIQICGEQLAPPKPSHGAWCCSRALQWQTTNTWKTKDYGFFTKSAPGSDLPSSCIWH